MSILSNLITIDHTFLNLRFILCNELIPHDTKYLSIKLYGNLSCIAWDVTKKCCCLNFEHECIILCWLLIELNMKFGVLFTIITCVFGIRKHYLRVKRSHIRWIDIWNHNCRSLSCNCIWLYSNPYCSKLLNPLESCILNCRNSSILCKM